MSEPLIPLLLRSLLAGVRGEVRRQCPRLLFAALLALAATMGFGMLALGAFLFLAETMAAPLAAAATGIGLLVLAGAMALVVLLVRDAGSGRRDGGATMDRSVAGSADLLRAAAAAIDRDARSGFPLFALMALVAGCAIGASPELRRVVRQIIL